MDYISVFIQSLQGKYTELHRFDIKKCKNCNQKLRIPEDKGKLKVICPSCNYTFFYSPKIIVKKILSIPLLLVGGILSGIFVAYLNHFYDITNLYLFFIFPIGAIIFSLISNIGFVAILSFIRIIGMNYSKIFIFLLSGFIALFAFWLSQYIIYSTNTITVEYTSRVIPFEIKEAKNEMNVLENELINIRSIISQIKEGITEQENKIKQINKDENYLEYEKLIQEYNNLVNKHNRTISKEKKIYNIYKVKYDKVNALINNFNNGNVGEKIIKTKEESISSNYKFSEYIKKTYENRSFRAFGVLGKIPIATPSADVKMGSFGLIFLLIKQIGVFFALPIVWLYYKQNLLR